MATIEETLRKLGLAAARGVPQLATGFVDLAALPFTMTGVMKPEQAVGSTAYLTSKGLLPPPQEGLLSETTELVSSSVNPAAAAKTVGLIGATKAGKGIMETFGKVSTELPTVTNAKPLEQIVRDAEKANVKLDVYEKNGVLNLSRIVVPKEQRKSGIGSQIMNDLTSYADASNAKMALSPSTDFGGTSVTRLKDFYKKFGFVENKGKNKDFSISETMYRDTQK
jgi:predicted GNAT family N-acyltransferase